LLKRWLLEVGRDEEARKVVYKLHGSSNEEAAEKEYAEMRGAIKQEVSIRRNRLSDLWSTPAMTRRTFVAVGVQVFTQFTGINGTFNSSSPEYSIHNALQLSTTSGLHYTIVWVSPGTRRFWSKGKHFDNSNLPFVSYSNYRIYGAIGPIVNLL
jgi:hypothetical protein